MPLFAPTPGSPLWGSAAPSVAATTASGLPSPAAEQHWQLPAPQPRPVPQAGVWALAPGEAGPLAAGSSISASAAPQGGGWPLSTSGCMASSNGLNTSAAAFRPSFDGGAGGGGRHAASDLQEAASGLDTLPASLYDNHSFAASRQDSGSTCNEAGGAGSLAESRLMNSFGGSSVDGFVSSSPLASGAAQHFEQQRGAGFASGAHEAPASCASDDELNDIMLPDDVISSLFDDEAEPTGSAASGELPRVGLRTDAFGAFGSQGFGMQGIMQHADWGHTSLIGNLRV